MDGKVILKKWIVRAWFGCKWFRGAEQVVRMKLERFGKNFAWPL